MNKPICNVHIHTFNVQYVPERFVGKITPRLQRHSNSFGLKRVLRLLSRTPWLRKYAAFLKVGLKASQHKIFHDLRENEGYPTGTRFVVLPINFKYMGAGNIDGLSYEQQLLDLTKVTASAKGTLLPFVFTDPRMGSAEENRDFVKMYIEEKGFKGIKLYPALGYYPYDPRLELVYKYAEKNNLPIMTHCSSTGVYYKDPDNIPVDFTNPETFNKQQIDPFTKKPRNYLFPFKPLRFRKKKYLEKYADNFLNPVNYTDVLERFKELKICFAHFGLDNDQYKGKIKLPWHDNIKTLMKKYKNVYTDISYSLHYEKVRNKFAGYMTDDEINNKILYGTDYFMTMQEQKSAKTEGELFQKTQTAFGRNFLKIAQANIDNYLTSEFYEY
ncbi:MAG: amidohydrolase family protein [Cyclobacteriaceae bacterium]|nr:amidohydrolase family protein [Cyclobacteriaceae bacterium]